MVQSKIRKLRLSNNLSASQATKKLKISYSFLYKIERGIRHPGRELIKRMSKLYNCSKDKIYECLGEDEYKAC